MSYFTPLDKGKLLNFHWDPGIPLPAEPVEMYYIWDGTDTIERGEQIGILVWHVLPPVYLLMPDSDASSGQYGWYAQFGLVPTAVATLKSKDQGTSVILIEGRELPIQVTTKYLCF